MKTQKFPPTRLIRNWQVEQLFFTFINQLKDQVQQQSHFSSAVAGEDALQSKANEKGNIDRVSTRDWAQTCNFDPEKLFTKFFHDDIKYLLSMDNLWKKRRPPVPLEWGNLPDEGNFLINDSDGIRYNDIFCSRWVQ